MKIFNKNRKSFGNNNYRRNDRNNSYHSNDRNNKFGQKNGGRNKFMKSEQFHEEEDATPWHVMKQNLKPSIAIKNPEIEDDWNTVEKQKSIAAREEFMRQKDERHRKFMIDNERKTVSKWDSFSDVEHSEEEYKETKKNISESKITEIVSKEKKNKKNKLETSQDLAPQKTKLILKNSPQEIPIIEYENDQIIKKKSTVKDGVSVLELDIKTALQKAVKKKLKKPAQQADSPQETIIETQIDSPVLAKKKSKKKQQSVIGEATIEPPVPEDSSIVKKDKTSSPDQEKVEETFLESLSSQKQNEPLLFESTEIMKSGPRCFACRQFGHSLKQCRDFDNTSTRICIKCGSNEHAYQNCTVHKGRVFKFASCFICKQTGHISSQCKEKKNGVYPDGGNCRYCSSIDHLGFNCPRRPGRKKKRKFTKNHNTKPTNTFRKVQQGGGGGGRGRGSSGRIQKDNRIKKNFK